MINGNIDAVAGGVIAYGDNGTSICRNNGCPHGCVDVHALMKFYSAVLGVNAVTERRGDQFT